MQSRVDKDTLKDVLRYAKELLRHVHVKGVYVTRHCDGSSRLLVQIAVTDTLYDVYHSDKTRLDPTISPRERLWAVLSDNEDRFVEAIKSDWQLANWQEDHEIFAAGYKDHIDVNLVRLSTSSNFIQKRTVTYQPPLSEVAIWRLFDN